MKTEYEHIRLLPCSTEWHPKGATETVMWLHFCQRRFAVTGCVFCMSAFVSGVMAVADPDRYEDGKKKRQLAMSEALRMPFAEKLVMPDGGCVMAGGENDPVWTDIFHDEIKAGAKYDQPHR